MKSEEVYALLLSKIKGVASGFDHAEKTGDNKFKLYFTDGTFIELTLPEISESELLELINRVFEENADVLSGVVVSETKPTITPYTKAWINPKGGASVKNYISDVVDEKTSELEFRLDTKLEEKADVITTTNNVYDVSTTKNNIALASNGNCAESYNESYWVTDYIEIPTGSNVVNILNGLAYKILFINADKTYRTSKAGDNISFADMSTIPEARYLRIQFKKTTTPFESANNIKVLFDAENETIEKSLSDELSVSEKSCGWYEKIKEHSYIGEKINLNNTFDIVKIYPNLTAQSGCYFNGILFLFRDNATFSAIDIEERSLIGTYDIADKSIEPHCNSAVFGNEYYDSADLYPLVYINAYNNTSLPKGTCYAYRLQGNKTSGFTMTLVQTISIGFTNDSEWTDGVGDTRPYGNFVIDTIGNYLYVYTLLDTSKVTRFFKFSLPTIADGSEVTLNKSDIIEKFDVDYIDRIQDATLHCGKIYMNSGVYDKMYLSVINCKTKKVVSVIDYAKCGYENEPEILTIYNKKLIISFNTKGYYLLEF